MPEMNDPCANSRLAAIMMGVGPGAKLSKGWRAEFTDAMNCCVVCCWEARGRTPTTSAKTKRTCRATKPDGTPCSATAQEGKNWCYFHDPEKAEERRAAQARGGQEGPRQ